MAKILRESNIHFNDGDIALEVADFLTEKGYEVVLDPEMAKPSDYVVAGRRPGIRMDIYEVTNSERRRVK